MNKYIIAILLCLPLLTFAQVDEDKIWENARFEATQNLHTIYYTDVNNAQGTFNYDELIELKDQMFEKEGIVRIELLDLDRTFRIYHLEYIEVETIKLYVLPIESGVEIMERKRFRI